MSTMYKLLLLILYVLLQENQTLTMYMTVYPTCRYIGSLNTLIARGCTNDRLR